MSCGRLRWLTVSVFFAYIMLYRIVSYRKVSKYVSTIQVRSVRSLPPSSLRDTDTLRGAAVPALHSLFERRTTYRYVKIPRYYIPMLNNHPAVSSLHFQGLEACAKNGRAMSLWGGNDENQQLPYILYNELQKRPASVWIHRVSCNRKINPSCDSFFGGGGVLNWSRHKNTGPSTSKRFLLRLLTEDRTIQKKPERWPLKQLLVSVASPNGKKCYPRLPYVTFINTNFIG